jgi:cyanophycinase-like exopeptidase
MILGQKFYGFPGLNPGFNFLPGVTVLPHYDEIPESMIKPVRLLTGNNLTMLGIDGNTALVQCGEHYDVVGSGGITVWNRLGKTRYTQGPLPACVLGKE